MTRKHKKTEEGGDAQPSLATKRVRIADLRPDDRNARRHDRENLRAIAASLKSFGQRKPLVVHRETRRVIAGNGTLRAMKALGWTVCDVVEFDGTEEQARAYAVADNRSAAANSPYLDGDACRRRRRGRR